LVEQQSLKEEIRFPILIPCGIFQPRTQHVRQKTLRSGSKNEKIDTGALPTLFFGPNPRPMKVLAARNTFENDRHGVFDDRSVWVVKHRLQHARDFAQTERIFCTWDRQIRSNRANFFAARERNIGSNMREISLKPSEFFALGTDKFARTERTFSPPASEMSAPTGENFRSVERSFSHAGPPNIGPEAAKKFARTERIFSPTASEMLAATDENFRSSEQTVSLEALKFRSF